MMIKDIVNRESVNLTNCESEPIHIPGSIQPHGFLLGVQKQGFTIDYCSANSADYLNLSAEKLLGKPMQLFFSNNEITEFENYISLLSDTTQPFVFTINSIRYNTTVHISNQTIVLEFEPFPDGSMHLPDLYNQTRNFVSQIEGTESLQALCQDVADETRKITGYDRVMIYRFDKDYNGEVFAESKRDDLDSFFGLNYPHTDIPAQARELYLRNLLRMIVDVEYAPVPILTLDENFEQKKNLDLSISVLRSVSPMHIEYLKNMGVQGTMSISLIRNKKLWGLIACHHYSVKNVPHYTRLAAKLQGHFLTSQIDVRQVVEEHELNLRVESGMEQLSGLLDNENTFLSIAKQQPILYAFINARGVAIINNGQLYCNGNTPAETDIKLLAAALHLSSKAGNISSSKLLDIYPEAAAISSTAAGVIFYSLGKSAGDCIIWFRPEVEKTINWAGNPDKAMVKDGTTEKLSPRKSFALWKQAVKFQSQEWKAPELAGAAKFAAALQRQFHFLDLSREEDKLRKLSEKLKMANEELEAINWISAHDLKEPLRKIQIFASKIVDYDKHELPASISQGIQRIQSAAQRMRQLLDDILGYSLIGNKSDSLVSCDLSKILAEVIAELNEEIAAKKAVVERDTLPTAVAIPFQMRQLFTNLLQNALKFSKPDITPLIKVTCEKILNGYQENTLLQNAIYYKIKIADNGIGFDNTYSNKILTVFQRLHAKTEYTGTGIGLAICKKIMDNHEGLIIASGIENEGASFTLYLPASINKPA
jgi:chemotaxis family two-component system sensor kinase Cph1